MPSTTGRCRPGVGWTPTKTPTATDQKARAGVSSPPRSRDQARRTEMRPSAPLCAGPLSLAGCFEAVTRQGRTATAPVTQRLSRSAVGLHIRIEEHSRGTEVHDEAADRHRDGDDAT